MSTKQPYTDVRPSPIAGRQWYPDTYDTLAREVDRMLDEAPEVTIIGEIVGLIVPHAGYIYSGPIAATAFQLIRGMQFERVIIVSPMHSGYGGQPILTTAHQAYQTPLGVIPVDHPMLDDLGEHLSIAPVRNDPEHSLEIELPFLQRALVGEYRLVPLMLLDQSYPTALQLGRTIAKVVLSDGAKTLLVASSDLSHYHPLHEAERLDKVVLDSIANFDPEGVIYAEEQGHGIACGRGAIATILVAARELGATKAEVVRYGTSAEASGDTSQVVGYGAAIVYRA